MRASWCATPLLPLSGREEIEERTREKTEADRSTNRFRLASGAMPSGKHTLNPTTDFEVEVGFLAVRIVVLAELLGLISPSRESRVDREQVFEAMDAFARAGVGRRSATLGRRCEPGPLAAALRESLVAIEDSPLPENEWHALNKILGEDALAKFLGTSISSVHRYRSGERPTPDDIAWRLHTVMLVAADLSGSYNDFGIRRWFQRSRSALGGASPGELLAGDWSPDDDQVKEVRSLANALLGSPAT